MLTQLQDISSKAGPLKLVSQLCHVHVAELGRLYFYDSRFFAASPTTLDGNKWMNNHK